MSPEDQLSGILDEIERRVAAALGLTSDDVYEARQTGEGTGPAAFVRASIGQAQPMTACAENAVVETTIGFHLPQVEDERQRVTRVRHTMAVRRALLWGPGFGTAIPSVGLPQVTDMAVSELGDPDEGFLMGGLTYRFQTVLQKGG